MKPFIIALTLYLFVNISSCSTNDAPIVEPPNGETAEDSNTPTMNEQIRIIIGRRPDAMGQQLSRLVL